MVDGIRSGSEFARAAIDAARRNHERLARQLSDGASGSQAAQDDAATVRNPAATDAVSFEASLGDGLAKVNGVVNSVDRLPADLVSGQVTDLHEVAMRPQGVRDLVPLRPRSTQQTDRRLPRSHAHDCLKASP